jgi:hypothetical protein
MDRNILVSEEGQWSALARTEAKQRIIIRLHPASRMQAFFIYFSTDEVVLYD